MLDGLLQLITLAICTWILVSIGAKGAGAIHKFNKKAKRKARQLLKNLITDDE